MEPTTLRKPPMALKPVALPLARSTLTPLP